MTQHTHRYHGQVLTHAHEGGEHPHGYYEHDEDGQMQQNNPRAIEALADNIVQRARLLAALDPKKLASTGFNLVELDYQVEDVCTALARQGLVPNEGLVVPEDEIEFDEGEPDFTEGSTTYLVTIEETIEYYLDVKADTPGAARVKVREAMRLPGWEDPRHSEVQGQLVTSAVPMAEQEENN